jgi:hypothetical protein
MSRWYGAVIVTGTRGRDSVRRPAIEMKATKAGNWSLRAHLMTRQVRQLLVMTKSKGASTL